MQLARGLIIAGRFRLLHEVGSGGMASVWLANHAELGYPCAIKFLHPDLANLPVVWARFEQEAKLVAQLRSAHIVQVLDYGTWEGIPYMALEYLEGEDLRTRLDRCGRLDARETFGIIDQVARGLTKAHAARLIHRDLKPENIFLARDDDREIAKVLDFGVAKALGGSAGAIRTQQGALIGTLEYMSPEQLRGVSEIDHRADLWSLAVVAFVCLTGHQPFEAERLNDLVQRVFTGPRPRASTFVAGLERGFDAWWERAAARDIDARFSNAREMVDSLAYALRVPKPPPRSFGGYAAPPASVAPDVLAVGPTTRHAPVVSSSAVRVEADGDIDVHVTGVFHRTDCAPAPDSQAPVCVSMEPEAPIVALPIVEPRRPWRAAAAAAIVLIGSGAMGWRSWRANAEAHARSFAIEAAAFSAAAVVTRAVEPAATAAAPTPTAPAAAAPPSGAPGNEATTTTATLRSSVPLPQSKRSPRRRVLRRPAPAPAHSTSTEADPRLDSR